MSRLSETIVHCPLEVVNISLVNAPILKDYYWRSLNIAELNETLLHLVQDAPRTVFLKIPPMPINSPPMKICFHLLNSSMDAINWGLKREQLCTCSIIRKPVGLSTFRNSFDCPHRDLLKILPASANAPAQGLSQFTLNVTYGCTGEHVLGYVLDIHGVFKLNLRFGFDIYEFDPVKLVLTNSLFPMSIYRNELVTQPIWMHNPFSHDLDFTVASENPNITIVEEDILLKRKTTYPILVQFRPTRIENVQLNLTLTFMGIGAEFNIEAPCVFQIPPIPAQQSPIIDFYCPESPYSIYKNYLAVNIGMKERITKMIVLHNSSTDCIQFLWMENILKGYFQVEVTPNVGSLKFKRSCSCIIKVTSESKQIEFSCIPITCEIYDFSGSRIDNVEEYSIDSSLDEIREKSILITRLFVNLHVTCKAKTSYDIPVFSPNTLSPIRRQFATSNFDRDIFDKLFWNFIYNRNFLSDILRKKCERAHGNVTKETEALTTNSPELGIIKKSASIEILQQLTVRSVEEIQRNWRFIPDDLMTTTNY